MSNRKLSLTSRLMHDTLNPSLSREAAAEIKRLLERDIILERRVDAAKRAVRKLFDSHHEHLVASDFMCYPQLNPKRDAFSNGEPFAQALRSHIEHCIADPKCDHEDPTQTIIY